MFKSRSEAGMLLASRLKKYQNMPGVILAVPRGGVPVAYEVAKELNIPLELILVKKTGTSIKPGICHRGRWIKRQFCCAACRGN